VSGGDVLLAFDFGLRRIGIASGNLITCTASPVTTLDNGRSLPWHQIDQLVNTWQPSTLLVGLPPKSGASSISEQVENFAAELKDRYDVTVVTVDETLTSHSAEQQLREARRSGLLKQRIGKSRLDRHAACLIAEQWMHESQHVR